MNLLIIEDDREDYLLTRELLGESLSPSGTVEWKNCLKEGLKALATGAYDACISDYRLGGNTAFDLLKSARANGYPTPILLFTGHREPGLDVQALAAGAADYLNKGELDALGLDRAIRFAIFRNRLQREAALDKERLAALGASVGKALTHSGCAHEVLQPCAEALARFLPIQLVQIHVFFPKEGELKITASAGKLEADPPSYSPAAIDFVQGSTFLSCPASEDHRLGDSAWLESHKIQSAITYPLSHHEHLLGLITLYSNDVLTETVVHELGSVAPGIGSYLARLMLEAQVRRTQQLDCVGKMAAGLAHEFKNNLMVIGTHAEQILQECPGNTYISECIQSIKAVSDSATGLAQQLMLFAKPQGSDPRPIDLSATLLSMRSMIQGAVDQRVGLNFQCLANPTIVEADQGLLQQVFINLAVNARDAMPKGGTLCVRTDNVEIDTTKAATNPEAVVGRFVRIQVSDTGSGMTPETLARVFEPFFTTKPPGKGNGLGLATVFNIVREHHGWIEVTSEEGKGTTFKIYLPESTKPVPSREVAEGSPVAPSTASTVPCGKLQRVLIVEDEPVLRFAAEQALQKANFEVYGAGSGQEALKIWEEAHGNFDLLLTDLSMPEGMTGVQLATQLVLLNPRLKVILTSGYAPEMVDHSLGDRQAVFLQKPYSPSSLPQEVGKCLGI